MGWLVTLLSIGMAAGAPLDLHALVTQAGQHAAAQEAALEHVTVTTTATQQELNGKGEVKHNSEIVSKSTPVDGHKKYEIVKAFEDGKDLGESQSKRLRMAEHGTDKPGEGRMDNPFFPSEQSKYQFTLLKPDPKHPGWTRVGFKPSGKASVNLVEGEALIDADGYLRHLSDRPSQNPSHMDEMHSELDYATQSPWGPLRTKMTVEAKGKIFFFFHRQVRGSLTYAYDLPTAPAEPVPPAPTQAK